MVSFLCHMVALSYGFKGLDYVDNTFQNEYILLKLKSASFRF